MCNLCPCHVDFIIHLHAYFQGPWRLDCTKRIISFSYPFFQWHHSGDKHWSQIFFPNNHHIFFKLFFHDKCFCSEPLFTGHFCVLISILASYLGSTWFRFHQSTNFIFSLSSSRQMPGYCLEICHDCLLFHPCQYIVYNQYRNPQCMMLLNCKGIRNFLCNIYFLVSHRCL
jgi:hypothetical protein